MLEIRESLIKPTTVLTDDEREQLEKLLTKILDATMKRLNKKLKQSEIVN
jgi:hypothetical protein